MVAHKLEGQIVVCMSWMAMHDPHRLKWTPLNACQCVIKRSQTYKNVHHPTQEAYIHLLTK